MQKTFFSYLGLSSVLSPAATPALLAQSVSGTKNSTNGRDPNAKSATTRLGNRKGYLNKPHSTATEKHIGFGDKGGRPRYRERERERERERAATDLDGIQNP